MSFYGNLNATQRLYSMYFIAKYESSWSWDGHNYFANVNYGDPFTVGIMQQAGSMAYHFLKRMRSGTPNAVNVYNALPASWRAAVDEGDGSSKWGGYSMTREEVDQWSSAVAANLDEMKIYSEWHWCESDEPDSLQQLLHAMQVEVGMVFPENPTLDDVRKIFFYLARYNNTGYNIKRVYDVHGLASDLVTIKNAMLDLYRTYTSWGIYGAGWTNAIEDNVVLLSKWDGNSVPDFGQVAGYGVNDGTGSGPGGTPGGVEEVTSWETRLSYADFYGEQLVLHIVGGKEVTCFKTVGNVYVPFNSTLAQGSTSPSDQSGTSTPSSVIARVMRYYLDHANMYGYSIDKENDGDYDEPETSGVSNCSAYIRYVARVLAPGSEMANMPWSYTGVMAETGRTVAKGTKNTPFPYDKAMPGDVLLVNWSWDNPDYDHVELYLGTPAQGNVTGSELWGAGSSPLPHKNGSANEYVKLTYNWCLQRISWS